MSDNPVQAPQSPRTAQTRSRGNQARRQPMSRESKFVGYLVLGLGVLAVVTVLILAFSGGVDTNEATPDPAISAQLQKDMSEKAPVVATPKEQFALPRQEGIKASDLTGGWQATIADYVAVLQMDKGVFQIILARAQPEFPRLYSSGTYRMVDDIVVLETQRTWKPPVAPPGSGIDYERLTSSSYPMIVGFKDNAMVWQNVPQSEKRMYVPSRSPLLLSNDKDYIVWKKVN